MDHEIGTSDGVTKCSFCGNVIPAGEQYVRVSSDSVRCSPCEKRTGYEGGAYDPRFSDPETESGFHC